MNQYLNREIIIENKKIGDNCPCFIIAEIGSNHNQSYEFALELIDLAAESGVDAVKFQTFRASEHISKNMPEMSYLEGENIYELIESLELDRSWQAGLKKYAESKGLIFFSSPCDEAAIKELSDLNVSIYKMSSFDITDDILITQMAKTNKTLLISTGMSTLNDIQYAVDAAYSVGNNQIVLLQCTSLYPAPVNLSNLRAMSTMRSAFGTLVGYSDHTMGDHTSIAAVAMGACVIEKHFTSDRTLPGPDHKFAIEPKELAEMVNKIRDIESGFGNGIKNGPCADEVEMFGKGRRSIHASVAISKGEVITSDMLKIKRPGFGIQPSFRKLIIGRVAKCNIEADEWLTWEVV